MNAKFGSKGEAFPLYSFRTFRCQGVHAGYDGHRVELGNE